MVTKFADALARTFMNKELRGNSTRAGLSYVSAQPREGQVGRRKSSRITIAQVSHCGHINRICIACAYSWGWDYFLDFHRTVGGRKLEQKLIESGQNSYAIADGKGQKPE